MESVAILGLGLIGGSLARDLAAAGVRVLGHDADPATVRAAQDAGVLHKAIDAQLDVVEDVDAVVLATPVDAAIDLIARAHRSLASAPLVMDVCSTKRSIMEAARHAEIGDRFVGAHPLTGDHRGGWSASRTGLFRGASVYLCEGGGSAGAVERARTIWRIAGAEADSIDPAVHDALLARISHLPQVVSTALARTILRSGIGLDRLGPGGRGMTRLAHSTPSLWMTIAVDNADLLAPVLHDLERELGEVRAALERGDRDRVLRFFDLGGEGKQKIHSGGVAHRLTPIRKHENSDD